MVYDDFINAVAERAHLSPEQATTVTGATFETLADRISGGETDDLADRLPDRLAEHLRKAPTSEVADSFGLGEFVQRVGARAGLDAVPASAGVRAVFTTLREAVSGDEYEDVVAQLPKEFGELVEPVGSPMGVRRRTVR